MDVELNGTVAAKSVVADKKRLSTLSEPPVLSRCEDPVVSEDDGQSEPRSSPPSLHRETYVTRQRSLDHKAYPTVYRFNLQRADRSERRNGATAGFGKVALRLLSKRQKRKQRKQLKKRKEIHLAPLVATVGRTTRSRTAAAASVVSTIDSSENCVNSKDLEEPTKRVLRPRKSEVNSPAPGETKSKSSPVHVVKEVAAKDKPGPEEVDLVDGIEILAFSSLEDLEKYTEAQEALKGPVHISDEDVDFEYFSDMEDEPAPPSMFASNMLNLFATSDSSRTSLFDSSDGEADRSASRNDDEAWNMRDIAEDEASCSSSKLATADWQAKPQDTAEMPKVGQVVDLGLGRLLRPETARNVHRLLDQSGTLSRKLAEFSASVVTQKDKPEPKARLMMPVVCPKMLDIMRYKWAAGDRGEQVTLSTVRTRRDAAKPGPSSFKDTKTLLEPKISEIAERPKRKPEALRQRPRKKARKSREVSSTAAAADTKSDSENEAEETKIISEMTPMDDTPVAPAPSTETKPNVVKIQEPQKAESPKKQSLKKESPKEESPPKQFVKVEPLKEVEEIVREMVDFVALKDLVNPIPYDPDQSEGHEDDQRCEPPVKIPVQKKRGGGLLCELRRLDVTVFDMDEKAEEETPALVSTSIDENCEKDICRLGCVCESLAGRRAAMPTHCGRVDCMFECRCSSISYERRTEGRHLLDVSDATLAWIQDESERNLAKVERQFKQTVVRAKDDLIVMGSKRSRREIKLPERYRENYLTTKDFLLELPRSQKKSLTTPTPPLTPTNKSLSPTKLITPPKIPSSKPAAPLPQPKFDEPIKGPPTPTPTPSPKSEPKESDEDTDSEVESSALGVRPCSVLLYRNEEEPPRRGRNIALKSTSKVRHSHNIIQSSARTSCSFAGNHRESKKNESKLTTLWNQHSTDNEVFCHIVKEHSISPEEWERSGELASVDEPLSPLKKNPNSVQLIPWSFLRDKFKKGDYHIWYKCQTAGNKQKLYLTDGPAKPNKSCINLRELDSSLFKGLPEMICKLVVKREEGEDDDDDDDKDARCFIKSIGDYWMIAGYMQRTGAGNTTDNSGLTVTIQSSSKTSEDELVEIGDPRSLLKTRPMRAQARWWLLHLTRTFDMLLFPGLGVRVKYSQIKKTATLANRDPSGTFIRMCLKKNTKFGLYGVPGMTDCVLIGPYTLEQKPGFRAYSLTSSIQKRYVRVPIFCANKDTEYELETRKLASPEWLEQVPHRVIGTWLYDFKSLDFPRPVIVKDQERRLPDETSDENFSSELRNILEGKKVSSEEPEPSMLPMAGTATPARAKVRSGQSLLKGSDEVKAINKNTLSVKIDGKTTEALVHVGDPEMSDDSKQGKLKIRQDLMKMSTPRSGSVSGERTVKTSASRKKSIGNVVKLENDNNVDNAVDTGSSSLRKEKKEPKRDYIVSNIRNLGYIPVTYVNDNSVFIPHCGIPGQVRFFRTHDEVVKYVYQNVRQKIHFIGFRPETISWRQVDSLEEVNGEKQFNPGILVGNHVITRAGLINLVKLTEEEIPTLNLPPKHAEELANKLDHIKSLPLLRQLGRLLVGATAGPLPQNAIVFMAVSELEKLAAQGLVLKAKRKELLREQSKIEEKLRDLMKGVPEKYRQKAQQEIDKIRIDKPVIVLDEVSDDEGSVSDADPTSPPAQDPAFASAPAQTPVSSPFPDPVASLSPTLVEAPPAPRPAAAPSTSPTPTTPPHSKEFAVSEMVNLSSDEEGEETVPTAAMETDQPPATEFTVNLLPTSATVNLSSNSPPCFEADSDRKPQGLVCKFPFSPLKRVNVTVKEDGIVATSSTNMIKLNQPVRTLTRNSNGSLIKAIKIVDPNSCQPRVISAPQRSSPNIIRPTLKPAPGVVQQKVQLVRAVPGTSLNPQPRAVFMTRSGATVPMTVVRQKPGENFVKLVTPNNDKFFIASSLPMVKSTADLKASGLKVLRPNIAVNQRRLGSATKPPVIRILKPVTSTATRDNSISISVSPSPSEDVGPSLLKTSTAGIAEIDTTELVID